MISPLKKILAVITIVGILQVYPVREVNAEIYLLSKYTCLLDADTGELIYSENADVIRAVASTTKMMTAILAVEYAGLEEVVEISRKADRTPEYTIGLIEGQNLSVSELLKAALIKSSNDAAVALAEHVAGNEKFFSYLMSKKAFVIGAFNTFFTNASGLPDQEHVSTAYDLAVIGRYLLGREYINELVGARTIEFQHPGYQEALTITNTNGLLNSYEGANGIKTGTTDAAGKCLVAAAKRNGRQLIAVSLNSPDRNGDCIRLLNYGFNEVALEKIIDRSIPFKQINIINGTQEYLDIYPEKDLSLWRETQGQNIEKKVEIDYWVRAPVGYGQELGVLHVYVNNKLFSSIKLISRDNIDEQKRITLRLKEIFN